MVALQIRDVPDDVRSALAEAAARRGQSMQAYLLRLVTDEAWRSKNVELLSRFADRSDGSSMSGSELDVVLAREQAERDRRGDTT